MVTSCWLASSHLHCLNSGTMLSTLSFPLLWMCTASIHLIKSLLSSVQCHSSHLLLTSICSTIVWTQSFSVLMSGQNYCNFHFLMVMSNWLCYPLLQDWFIYLRFHLAGAQWAPVACPKRYQFVNIESFQCPGLQKPKQSLHYYPPKYSIREKKRQTR